MDYRVEATVHLYVFPDKDEVRRILKAHGFGAEELSGGHLRVFGSFQELRAVRARLIDLQTRRAASGTVPQRYRDTPPWYGPTPPNHRDTPPWYGSAPSGAIPRLPREPRLQYDSAPSPSESPRHQQVRASPPSPSILVDANVFRYAQQLRWPDISHIEASGDVRMEPTLKGETVSVSLRGRGSEIAAAKLRRLFEELDTSLRTQEVWLSEVVPAARHLLSTSTHDSVLLRQCGQRVCLIGPSTESYELKQRLLGKPVERSGRRGRSLDRSSGRRSNSVPARRKEGPQRDAVPPPPPTASATAAAHAYSPSKYVDDKEGGATARPNRSARDRRSHSESRSRNAEAPTPTAVQQSQPKQTPMIRLLKPLLPTSYRFNKKPAWKP